MYTELVKFAQYLIEQGRSQHTIDAYVKDVEQLISTAAISSINEITEERLVAYINSILQLNVYERKTISRKVNSIRKFVQFINEKYKLQVNMTALRSPKPLTKKQRILSKEEILKIRRIIREDHKCFTMFEVLLQTGMKISELAVMTVRSVDLQMRCITVPVKPERTIPLTDKLYFILKDYLHIDSSNQCEYVFHTSNFKPIQIRNIRGMLDRHFKRAGVENIMINDLRNTFIVRQLEALNNIYFVSNIVGHSSIAATLRYEKLAHIKGGKRNKEEIVEL